jgi:hypothetical protein
MPKPARTARALIILLLLICLHLILCVVIFIAMIALTGFLIHPYLIVVATIIGIMIMTILQMIDLMGGPPAPRPRSPQRG